VLLKQVWHLSIEHILLQTVAPTATALSPEQVRQVVELHVVQAAPNEQATQVLVPLK